MDGGAGVFAAVDAATAASVFTAASVSFAATLSAKPEPTTTAAAAVNGDVASIRGGRRWSSCR
jgi:hypothetical protein